MIVIAPLVLVHVMFALGNFALVVADPQLSLSALGIVIEGALSVVATVALTTAAVLFRRPSPFRASVVAFVGTLPLAGFLGLAAAFFDNAVELFYASLVVPGVAGLLAAVLRIGRERDSRGVRCNPDCS